MGAALGRIGSLKLKQGDKNGALTAYASLFKEVDTSESPVASRLEKAKVRFSCLLDATPFYIARYSIINPLQQLNLPFHTRHTSSVPQYIDRAAAKGRTQNMPSFIYVKL